MFECMIPLGFGGSRAIAGKRLANKRDEKMGGQEVEEEDLARSGSKSRRAGFGFSLRRAKSQGFVVLTSSSFFLPFIL